MRGARTMHAKYCFKSLSCACCIIILRQWCTWLSVDSHARLKVGALKVNWTQLHIMKTRLLMRVDGLVRGSNSNNRHRCNLIKTWWMPFINLCEHGRVLRNEDIPGYILAAGKKQDTLRICNSQVVNCTLRNSRIF